METVDVQKEVLEEVELMGRMGYFTELRVDKETVPEGMHCYELRHGDDDGFPVSVEENVRVNYFGAVLLAETLELGKEKALQFGYEDFRYTGEQIYLPQVIGEREPEDFKDGKELAELVAEEISITEEEGRKLIGYMEGHDYCLGHMDGKLFRGDLCYEQGKVHWEPYTIDDAINVDNESNWLDLRQEDGSETQNYWCHGAPGIILARLKCFENTDDIEMRSIIKEDIQGSLVNLTRYELIDEKDCLCHGFWGNIDILVSLGVYDAGILKLAKQYANKHIQGILQNGFAFPNDNNEEVYNFMLGISGVGYALLRLTDIDMPSILALEI